MAEYSASSTVANLAGLLTFASAVIAAIWLRISQLRQFDRDIAKSQEMHDWCVMRTRHADDYMLTTVRLGCERAPVLGRNSPLVKLPWHWNNTVSQRPRRDTPLTKLLLERFTRIMNG